MAGKAAALTVQVAIVGGGPAGLTAAIALAEAGIETALIARAAADDHRTTALLAGSVTALDTLGVWARCRDHAAPLKTMRLVDDTSRLIRAPEVSFAADEIGLEAFGYNIENRHLLAALNARADELPSLKRIEDEAGAVETGENAVTVRLHSGKIITAKLVIGADGRRSLCRAAAGIEIDGSSYPQVALTFNLSHARSHTTSRPNFTPRPDRSRWCLYRANAPAWSASSMTLTPNASSRSTTPRWQRKSKAARIRSSARSALSRAAAHFLSRSRPRGFCARTASR